MTATAGRWPRLVRFLRHSTALLVAPPLTWWLLHRLFGDVDAVLSMIAGTITTILIVLIGLPLYLLAMWRGWRNPLVYVLFGGFVTSLLALSFVVALSMAVTGSVDWSDLPDAEMLRPSLLSGFLGGFIYFVIAAWAGSLGWLGRFRVSRARLLLLGRAARRLLALIALLLQCTWLTLTASSATDPAGRMNIYGTMFIAIAGVPIVCLAIALRGHPLSLRARGALIFSSVAAAAVTLWVALIPTEAAAWPLNVPHREEHVQSSKRYPGWFHDVPVSEVARKTRAIVARVLYVHPDAVLPELTKDGLMTSTLIAIQSDIERELGVWISGGEADAEIVTLGDATTLIEERLRDKAIIEDIWDDVKHEE